MSRHTAARLAWSLCALTGGVLACSVILSGGIGGDYALFAIGLVAYALVGAVVASRRPANVVGWVLLSSAVGLALQEFAREYATRGLLSDPGSLPLAPVMAWLLSWVYLPAIMLLLAFLPLYFPDGQLPSPRWRWVARFAILLTIALAATSALLPGEIKDTGVVNPLGIEALQPVLRSLTGILEVALFSIVFASVASLLVRFRRSVSEERQQIKWLLFAAAASPSWFLINPLLVAAFPALSGIGFAVVDNLLFAGIPVAVGIAVLKYRLYDIDVIINRTLVYGSLTAMLALVYLGGVVGLQAALRILTGQESTLAIVASTLVIAALFSPLRRRVQELVDRRFYRRKYDAVRTLEAFNARLRDETELDTLTNDLAGVVRETMQPTHVSLWLRSAPGNDR